jgi:hypothetical protein
MTTIKFKQDIELFTDKYDTIADFLGAIDYSLIYEEYLERKLLESKSA